MLSVGRAEKDTSYISQARPKPLLQLVEPAKDSGGVSKTYVMKVVFSLNGGTLFVISTTDGSPATLKGWDISSGMFTPGKLVLQDFPWFSGDNLVAVREGVLLQTSDDALELWNFELSECMRSWTDLENIITVISISEERVACKAMKKVIIVDTTREGILSTIPIHSYFVACNSKCHMLTADIEELQMQCGDKVLWKMPQPFRPLAAPQFKTFSPTEQYFVFGGIRGYVNALCVLDAVLGKKLHILQLGTRDDCIPLIHDCKFVSEEECVSYISDVFSGYFLQLFNVKSGDQLSEITLESRVYSLAACSRERLIAIAFYDPEVNFKVLQVTLPRDKHCRDKHSRNSKRSGFIKKEQSYNTISSTESLAQYDFPTKGWFSLDIKHKHMPTYADIRRRSKMLIISVFC